MYIFQNLHDDVFRWEELRSAVQQVLLGKVDECFLIGYQFFETKFEHSPDHNALRCDITVKGRVKCVLQTAAEENLICVYLFLLIQYSLPANKCFLHREPFYGLDEIYTGVFHRNWKFF